MRTVGFDLREVIPLQLEAEVCGGQRTRGTVLKQIHGMGTRRYVYTGLSILRLIQVVVLVVLVVISFPL